MASSREALRVFQSRLANRLQEARATGAAASWLAVEAAGVRYLFPLTHAGEIFPWAPIHPVPHVARWFLGVVNLRGGVSGVVDLGAFVSGGAVVQRTENAQSQSRLIAFSEALQINCTLLIDRLAGLKSVESFTASAAPAEGAPVYYGHRYTDAQGVSWQELNLQALSIHPPFLSISA